jgi:hypothetical protein
MTGIKIRLWHGALRRLHSALGRVTDPLLHYAVDSIGSAAVTTIEAIEETAAGQKIQKAWLDLEVVRCGYCQSGQKGRLTMSLDHLASRVAGPSLSRRSFLYAGAAAGGGLMLSLTLPFANGCAEGADVNGLVPNAFIRIERDGQIVLTMPYVEMGRGTYTSIPMLIDIARLFEMDEQ